LEIRKVKIENINPAPYNPRKDLQPGDKEYEALKKSIEEFGYIESIVWNERTGHLVGGHQRFKILVAEGETEIDVSVVNLDLDKEKALNIALNKISGDWDDEKLYNLLNELNEQDLDISLTGFDPEEALDFINNFHDNSLSDIGDLEDDNFDIEEALEESETETRTAPGDIWLLGRHRLMCGDSTNEEDVQKLMDGQLADMIFTDPPYNVNYQGSTKDKLTIENDNMDSELFYQFLNAAYRNMANSIRNGGAIYVCHADIEWYAFRKALVENGFLLKQCLIWVKNSFILSRSDYHWQHEPILYGWKEGAAHTWNGDRLQATVIEEKKGHFTAVKEKDHYILTIPIGEQHLMIKVPDYEVIEEINESTIWRVDKPQRNADHPTMKPIALPVRAIRNSCLPNDIVLDLFGGSGSTLMAAEKTGRKCYTMEYSPNYCDVIVKRYEELTGEKAIKAK